MISSCKSCPNNQLFLLRIASSGHMFVPVHTMCIFQHHFKIILIGRIYLTCKQLVYWKIWLDFIGRGSKLFKQVVYA